MTEEKAIGSLSGYTEKKYRGIPLFEYEITDSTNTRAKEFYKNGGHPATPAIFISHAQSAGRGTRGRSFESPPESGIYMSILFYPALLAADASKITTYAATRVISAIDKFLEKNSPQPMIKWVNDIYIETKKIAGILTEGETGADGFLSYAIIGIGINVKRGLPEYLADVAATLEDFGINIERDELCREIIDEFLAELENLGTERILNEYRKRSMLIGRDVIMSTPAGEEKIRVSDIADNGALIGFDVYGNQKSYFSGDARVIFK